MKKFLFYLSIALLALASSVVLALLSATGLWAMIAAFPIAFPVAVALVGLVFALAIVYEWEIYWQNIKSAVNKLFNKPMLLENKLGKEFLLKHFPKFDETTQDVPDFFFDDYKKFILKLDALNNKEKLSKSERLQKKHLIKQLAAMEKRFSRALLTKNNSRDKYIDKALNHLFRDQTIESDKQAYLAKLKRLKVYLSAAKVFSIAAGFFMGVSTTYLLVEALGAVTFFSLAFGFWPLIIIPLAIAGGVAYGFLTYNAVSDMIVNETVQNWFKKLTSTIKNPSVSVVLIALLSVVLIGLAVTLTIFTAGTWWTIAQKSRPLFGWMAKIPGWIMAIGNISIIGLSSLIFNVQNMYETLGMIETFIKGSIHGATSVIKQQWRHIIQRDNLFQLLNPFRMIITAIELPLRIILFLGHIISIALSTDRPPMVPHWIAFIFGFTVELGEDLHYFFEASEAHHGHDHQHHHGHDHHHGHHYTSEKRTFKDILEEYGHQHSHGHHHGLDIPTWIIRIALSPLYSLAILWDYGFQDSKHKRTLESAFKIQLGLPVDLDDSIEDLIPVTEDSILVSSEGSSEDLNETKSAKPESIFHGASKHACVQICLNKIEKSLNKVSSSYKNRSKKDFSFTLKNDISENPTKAKTVCDDYINHHEKRRKDMSFWNRWQSENSKKHNFVSDLKSISAGEFTFGG